VDATLRELKSTIGVEGVCVCGGEGQLRASSGMEHFSPQVLSAVARSLIRTFDGLQTARRRKITDFDFLFEARRVIVKNLGPGCLIIVCTPNVNLPLLNQTATITARKLRAVLESTAVVASQASAGAQQLRGNAGAPGGPQADGSPTLVDGLSAIVEKHMGEGGKVLFVRRLAEAHMGKDSSPEQLARWLPGFGYALSFTAVPSDAQQMVDEMMDYLVQRQA
jgi:hypothetical protein